MPLITRRFFTFAAPAIAAAPSLMRVSAAVLGEPMWNVDDMAAEAERRILDQRAVRGLQALQKAHADQLGMRYADYHRRYIGELSWR